MGLDRVRITSTGYSGATGYTNLYFTSATTANLNAVRALFDAVKGFLPTVVRFTFPAAGDTIDETDGHLLGGWSGVAPADVVGYLLQVAGMPAGSRELSATLDSLKTIKIEMKKETAPPTGRPAPRSR